MTTSLFIVAGAIIGLLVLILAVRLHAFPALIIVAVVSGLALGMGVESTLATITKGVGSTLGGLALLLGLGAILGGLIAETGAAHVISDRLLSGTRPGRVPWALTAVAFLIGIPLFYTVGFVLLVPIVFAAARRTGLSLPMLGVATVAALSVTHGFLPPHPAPVLITDTYGADLGRVLLYGILLAVPAVILAGPLFARTLRNMHGNPPPELFAQPILPDRLPSLGLSLTVSLFPVILIALTTLLRSGTSPGSYLDGSLLFFGDATVALLLGILIALPLLARANGKSVRQLTAGVGEYVKPIAIILLIIAAGGAFKQVLVDSGTSAEIVAALSGRAASPVLIAWGVAAALRITLGSATVAAVTAAGMVQPLVLTGGVAPEILVLATGAGSLTCSHVNDTGFWLFKEYFGLTIGQTLRSWTVMETIVSLVGLVGCLLLAG
ncbi:MAG: gluconate:H+ symporter [Saprospiraceae bacterium]